jgi:hypothetical protein
MVCTMMLRSREVLTFLQVIRRLPARFAADVFTKLTDTSGSFISGFKRALYLPQDLLSCWVATTPAVLDLRTAELTAVQQSKLFAALPQGGLHLTEFHIRIVDFPDNTLCEITARTLDQYIQTGKNHVQACRTNPMHTQNLSDLDYALDYMQCEKSDGVVKRTYDLSIECAHLLSTIAWVLPQLATLQHFGLHNLQLHSKFMPALGQVLGDLPPSVTVLSLTTATSVVRSEVERSQRRMLFYAIGMIRSLRELHMPDWAALVGDDGTCVEPLFHLPHLQAVYVRAVTQSSAFPAKLPFKKRELHQQGKNLPVEKRPRA